MYINEISISIQLSRHLARDSRQEDNTLLPKGARIVHHLKCHNWFKLLQFERMSSFTYSNDGINIILLVNKRTL